MITRYKYENGRLLPQTREKESFVWVDMCDPSEGEIDLVNRMLGLDLPTLSEMKEIEISNRLYSENDAQYMTMTYIAEALSDKPHSTPITFVLKDGKLVTLRYEKLRLFDVFLNRAQSKGAPGCESGQGVAASIMENITDWYADILETNNTDIELMNQKIFSGSKRVAYQDHFKALGQLGARNSLIQESLVSFSRAESYFAHLPETKEMQTRLSAIGVDIRALMEQAGFIANKMTFLLDATLGLVNLEQNQIIKIFSIAAVIFMPPTLVASIYGMNFDFIPELHWHYGYPFALGLMLVSALIPWLYFTYKRWIN